MVLSVGYHKAHQQMFFVLAIRVTSSSVVLDYGFLSGFAYQLGDFLADANGFILHMNTPRIRLCIAPYNAVGRTRRSNTCFTRVTAVDMSYILVYNMILVVACRGQQ